MEEHQAGCAFRVPAPSTKRQLSFLHKFWRSMAWPNLRGTAIAPGQRLRAMAPRLQGADE
jgi:hypothetical protein